MAACDGMDKKTLERAVADLSFVMDDVRLFLDTHPRDEAALCYYNKARKERDTFVEQFTAKYGPINFYDAGGSRQWNWVEQPWPWEKEA